MSNLIITVIAIGLVAVASLIGIYYGGSSYLTNQSVATAGTVVTIAQQIGGAWSAYLNDHYFIPPTAITALVSGGYISTLSNHPAAPQIAAAPVSIIDDASTGHYWVWIDVGRPSGHTPDTNATTCLKIIKDANGTTQSTPSLQPATTAILLASNAAYGNGTFGCIQWNGTPSLAGLSTNVVDWNANDYLMYYLIQ